MAAPVVRARPDRPAAFTLMEPRARTGPLMPPVPPAVCSKACGWRRLPGVGQGVPMAQAPPGRAGRRAEDQLPRLRTGAIAAQVAPARVPGPSSRERDASPSNALTPGAHQGDASAAELRLSVLPAEVLTLLLRRVSRGTGGVGHLLTCRAWAMLGPEAQAWVQVRGPGTSHSGSGGRLCRDDVLRALWSFPALRRVTLVGVPAAWCDDALLEVLAQGCAGTLKHFEARDTSMGSSQVTAQGIAAFLAKATALQILELDSTFCSEMHLPGVPSASATVLNCAALRELRVPCVRWQRLGVSIALLQALRVLYMEFPGVFAGSVREDFQNFLGALASLPALEDLAVSKCPVPARQPWHMRGCSQLIRLRLQFELGIPSRGLFSFEALTSLQHLSVEVTGLDRVPTPLQGLVYERALTGANVGSLQGLRVLDLQGVADGHARALDPLTALTALEQVRLVCHRVDEWPSHLFLAWGLLRCLALSCEHCSSLPILANPSLQSLDVELGMGDEGQGPLLLPWDFQAMVSIEYLRLECSSAEEFPPGISSVRNLTHLSLAGQSLQVLPDFGAMQQLTALRIGTERSPCSSLCKLPESLGHLGRLRKLHLDCRGAQGLVVPDALGALGNLEGALVRCSPGTVLPRDFHACARLRVLELEIADAPDHPGDAWELDSRKVEVLCQVLPPTFFLGLERLRRLSLRVPRVNQIPESLDSAKCLQELTLDQFPGRTLPTALGHLTDLKVLSLKGCCALEEFPRSSSALSELTSLTLCECTALGSVMPMASAWPLQSAHLVKCPLQPLKATDICNFRSLRSLTLECAIQFLDFSPLCHLTGLFLASAAHDCTHDHVLPSSVSLLPALQHLRLPACCLELAPCISLLTLLTCLEGASHLLHVPAELSLLKGPFASLGTQAQKLATLPELVCRWLPSSVVSLCRLQQLRLQSCPQSLLPPDLGALQQLHELVLEHCPHVLELPPSCSALLTLQRLRLTNCPSLQSLPLAMGHLPLLRDVELEGCVSLREVPQAWRGLLWDALRVPCV